MTQVTRRRLLGSAEGALGGAFALAETFTICDNYFCSMFGPTWPNRLYWMTGTIDPGGTRGGPVLVNKAPTPYRWTTYAERLQAAGVSWKVYQQDDDHGCNMLEQFANFRAAAPGSDLYDREHPHGRAFDREGTEQSRPGSGRDRSRSCSAYRPPGSGRGQGGGPALGRTRADEPGKVMLAP